jgi:Golgi phosphoprotein 3
MAGEKLGLHEEILLLALRDEKGTFDWRAGNYSYAMAGGILAELLLAGRITVEESKKAFVNIKNPNFTGDMVVDACLEKIQTARRRKKLRDWVGTLGNRAGLKHDVARSLCRKGILQLEEHRVLSLFRTRRYPELTHEPERKIIDRLQQAIFSDKTDIDARTAILVALANSSGLLSITFLRKDLKKRKQRIKAISNGDCIGKATNEAIEALQAAIMVATIIPSMVVATAATS